MHRTDDIDMGNIATMGPVDRLHQERLHREIYLGVKVTYQTSSLPLSLK